MSPTIIIIVIAARAQVFEERQGEMNEEQEQREQQQKKIISVVLVGAMLAFILVIFSNMPTFKTRQQVESETKTPQQAAMEMSSREVAEKVEKARQEADDNLRWEGAIKIKRAAQNLGYPNVNAHPDGDVLVMFDPYHPPRDLAREMLARAKMRAYLIDHGFKTLRVKQSDSWSYGPGFDYAIEPVRSSKKGVAK
jgi:hypothetical protein